MRYSHVLMSVNGRGIRISNLAAKCHSPQQLDISSRPTRSESSLIRTLR